MRLPQPLIAMDTRACRPIMLAQADPLGPAGGTHLLAYLATIGDPRRASGRRHPLVAILAMAAAAG